MSSEKLGRRLEQLFATLAKSAFLTNRGIGNEIGFYIFSYDPEFEPVVMNYLPRLKERLGQAGVKVLEFNLYTLILDLLREKDVLDDTFALEARKGVAGLEKALKKIVRPEQLVAMIERRLSEPHDLVFLTGVGAAYPMIRSHTVLNNLHSVIDKVPAVMFFPGSYDGQELRLFNLLKDDNYYRAFPLLPEAAVGT
ncbi:MAG: DUF1788 domain-containing protein [Deinococcota bacterium]|nr:DUF1788 domain-containing protein [Deinococcota bacterium]